MRHYFIGDIHGCYTQLLELEEKIRDHAKDTPSCIVSVGDLVDRGPDSAKVLAHVLKGMQERTHIAVLGNHDDMFLAVVSLFRPDILPSYPSIFSGVSAQELYLHWLSQGGRTTLQSFNCSLSHPETWELSRDSIPRFATFPLIWESDRVIVSHALLTHESLSKIQAPLSSSLREELLWNRTLPSQRIHKKKLHISGHTVVEKVIRNKSLGFARIDTGCVFGGTLSAYEPESDTVLSVPG